jgi:hypothetical protein
MRKVSTVLQPELASRVAVYQQATGHDTIEAIQRLIEIGLSTWETDPHYMPERVCGRVRTVIHSRERAS